MTEQEFVRQVWRAFDTVEIEGGIKSKVLNVCFTTHSVRIRLANGVPDWVRCELIVKHTSGTAETEDAGIIEDLHNKLMKAEKRNDDLQAIVDDLNAKMSNSNVGNLRKAVNLLTGNLVSKKKTIERIDEALARINAFLDKEEGIEESNE